MSDQKRNALKEQASASAAATEDMKKERDEAVAECRSVRADAFLRKHAAVIGDAAACREVYLKDPDLAEKMVAACRAPAPSKAQQVLAPARAAQPPKAGGALEGLAKCRSAQERVAYVMAHAADFAAEAK